MTFGLILAAGFVVLLVIGWLWEKYFPWDD